MALLLLALALSPLLLLLGVLLPLAVAVGAAGLCGAAAHTEPSWAQPRRLLCAGNGAAVHGRRERP
jgi:hypothetical protein